MLNREIKKKLNFDYTLLFIDGTLKDFIYDLSYILASHIEEWSRLFEFKGSTPLISKIASNTKMENRDRHTNT